MASSNKRARKKQNQAARRAALEAARKRQQRRRQLLSYGGLAAGVVVVALVITFIASRGGGSGSSSTSSTLDSTVSTLAAAKPVKAGRTIKGDTPCPKGDGEKRASSFEKPPPSCIDPTKTYVATFDTSVGVVKAKLDTATTPGTVNNFVVLARYRYYDGSSFQRTDPAIDIVQGGAPSTQTIGDPGPGYSIKDEGGKFTYTEGDLVMARSQGADSGGAQYFISVGPKTSSLDTQGTYVTFGKVVEGLDVLKRVLASHVDCPEDRTGRAPCLGGAPQPPVIVKTVTIQET